MGVWIETNITLITVSMHCHTLRGCVDWNFAVEDGNIGVLVTPCVGVWIETYNKKTPIDTNIVTPCVGVWIETYRRASYPLLRNVTPCVGVWIETPRIFDDAALKGHTLRGCVDWNCWRYPDATNRK